MSDLASLARRCHDTGFEQGSVAACNAILAWLNGNGHSAVASSLLMAWDGGQVAEVVTAPAPLKEPPPAILLSTELIPASRPRLTRDDARGAGYVGDPCTACQSMQVKRNGSCLVCESCGQTTGCS